jgi:hypothetical protein
LQIASHHRVFPFSLLIRIASSTLFEIQIPNLCVFSQYFDFTFEIMALRFLRVYNTHHANAGSSWILDLTAYSVSPTRNFPLTSFKGTQVLLPSFQPMSISQPFVVRLQLRLLLCHTSNVLSPLSKASGSF